MTDASVSSRSNFAPRASVLCPMLLKGVLAPELNPDAWSLERLSAILGDRRLPIEYSLRSIYRPNPRLNGGRYFRKWMKARDAFGRIAEQEQHQSWVYCSNVSLTTYAPELEPEVPSWRLLSTRPPVSTVLFIGPGGSGTHFHYDLTDNAICVFRGAKTVVVFPPRATRRFSPYPFWSECAHFSSLRVEGVDIPDSRQINGAAIHTVEAGDALLLPSLWWHNARNVGVTIGMTQIWTAGWDAYLRWQHMRVNAGSWLSRKM